MSDINVILAERAGTGAVRLCGCNCIHMRIGPVTIQMVPEMFMEAVVLMKQAVENLAVIADAATAVPIQAQANGAKPN